MGQDDRDLHQSRLHAVSDRPRNVDRGTSPVDPLRFLRQLLGREPSTRQRARIVELQRQFDLRAGDSIFIIVAILEVYFHQVEQACLSVRRSTRRILSTACLTAVVSAAAMVMPLYFLDSNVRSGLGRGSPLPIDGEHQGAPRPSRVYLRAALEQMPEADVDRYATSRDAMILLQALPRASDGQIAAIVQYLQSPPGTKAH